MFVTTARNFHGAFGHLKELLPILLNGGTLTPPAGADAKK
jgi:hypothetical protein